MIYIHICRNIILLFLLDYRYLFFSLISGCFAREGFCFSASKGDGSNPNKAVAENTLDKRERKILRHTRGAAGLGRIATVEYLCRKMKSPSGARIEKIELAV